ncbi:MAG TPA: hypothetical protein VGC96_00635 [Candidatus Elarobacter sp.]|jgi:hypothetical protein
MIRTPPWVFVAAVGVQLAALGLCLWAMELHARVEEEAPAPPGPPPPAPPPSAPEPEAARPEAPLAVSPPADAPGFEPQPMRPHNGVSERSGAVVRAVDPATPVEPPWPQTPRSEAPDVRPAPPPELDPEPEPPAPKPRPAVVRVQQPAASAPSFGPPPLRPPQSPPGPETVPHFIGDAADETTQIVRGRAAEGRFAFGFYPDGNIRFVDFDGGRYAGKAESARARMREVDGTRAFTVQIGVAADGRLQATFTGGPHDAETIALEPLVGWSVA